MNEIDKVGPPVFRLLDEKGTIVKMRLDQDLWKLFLSHLPKDALLQFASTSKAHHHYLNNISPIWNSIREKHFPSPRHLPPFPEQTPYLRYLKTLEYFDSEIPKLHQTGRFSITLLLHPISGTSCCTMKENWLCTGAEDSLIDIWEVGEECKHLTSLGSHDGSKIVDIQTSDSFLGTLCERNILKIWDLNAKTFIESWSSVDSLMMRDVFLLCTEQIDPKSKKLFGFQIRHFTKTPTHFYASNKKNQIWEMDRKTRERTQIPLKIKGNISKLTMDQKLLQVHSFKEGNSNTKKHRSNQRDKEKEEDTHHITVWDPIAQTIVSQHTFKDVTQELRYRNGLIYRLNSLGVLTISKKESPKETIELCRNNFEAHAPYFQSFELHGHQILTRSKKGVELWDFRFSCPSSHSEEELQREWDKIKTTAQNTDGISKKEALICLELLLHALYQQELTKIRLLLAHLGPEHTSKIYDAYGEAMEPERSNFLEGRGTELTDNWEQAEWYHGEDNLHLAIKMEVLKKYRDSLLNPKV